MRAMLLLISLLLLPALANAKTASALKAPKGGELRTLGSLRFEMVQEGPYVVIYPYDESLQPVKAAPITVHVKVVAGKGAPRSAPLKVEQNFWEFKLEPAEQTRSAVEFYVDKNGQREKIRWAIAAKAKKG